MYGVSAGCRSTPAPATPDQAAVETRRGAESNWESAATPHDDATPQNKPLRAPQHMVLSACKNQDMQAAAHDAQPQIGTAPGSLQLSRAWPALQPASHAMQAQALSTALPAMRSLARGQSLLCQQASGAQSSGSSSVEARSPVACGSVAVPVALNSTAAG